MPDSENDKKPPARRITVLRRHTKLRADAVPADVEPAPGRIPVRRLDAPAPVELVADDLEAAGQWDERLWRGEHP